MIKIRVRVEERKEKKKKLRYKQNRLEKHTSTKLGKEDEQIEEPAKAGDSLVTQKVDVAENVRSVPLIPISVISDIQLRPDETMPLGGASVSSNPLKQRSKGYVTEYESKLAQLFIELEAKKGVDENRIDILVDVDKIKLLNEKMQELESIPDVAWLKFRSLDWKPNDPEFIRAFLKAGSFPQALPYLVMLMTDPSSVLFQPHGIIKWMALMDNYPSYRHYSILGAPEWPDVNEPSFVKFTAMVIFRQSPDNRKAMAEQLKSIYIRKGNDGSLSLTILDVVAKLILNSFGVFTGEEKEEITRFIVMQGLYKLPEYLWLLLELNPKQNFAGIFLQEAEARRFVHQIIDYGIRCGDPANPNFSKHQLIPSFTSAKTRLIKLAGADIDKDYFSQILSVNSNIFLNPKRIRTLLELQIDQPDIHGVRPADAICEKIHDAMKPPLLRIYETNLNVYPLLETIKFDEDLYIRHTERLAEAFGLSTLSDKEKYFQELQMYSEMEDSAHSEPAKALLRDLNVEY